MITAQKKAVREYFDRDADDYLRAYETAEGDARGDAFRERRRLVLEALREPLGRVLDVGSGPGVFTAALMDRGATCWIVDASHEMVAAARRRVSVDGAGTSAFLVGDAERLPLPDRSVNTVLCVGVLQYLNTIDVALGELARVTRPGGQIVLTFPNARSPLNRLHRIAVRLARACRAGLRGLGLDMRPSPLRLTFREDIPNRWLTASEIERCSQTLGLRRELLVYHSLQFPFSVPGLGLPVRAWNRLVRGRGPSAIFETVGREGIMRLVRET